ncbi:lysM domain receptor-like kinase 3 isoform X2 [Mangifera indica]|uniref:lysM domain receptor-like kinase 3 isoform X2 n=1 Tax=Mangifera indica TaxID=29780 RepID=UPI001CFBB1F2|nr:lysM domain receptor-like kinase 3 isoform X2 [Mangifera indica]
MCRSKRSTDVVSSNRRNSRSSRSSFKSKSSSVTVPSSGNLTSNDFFSKSSADSVASTSLTTLRESLVEKPHIYDFSEIRSATNNFLSDKFSSSSSSTSWRSSIRGKEVAADLAHGLDYIHHFSGLNSNVIHNHIKCSSIIVSEGDSDSGTLCAKFCHFGTAELCGEVMGKNDSKVRKIEGTRGYMSPEFQLSGVASQKSDVYAFGVVILELLSGDEALRFVVDEGSGVYRRISVIERAGEAAAAGGGGVRRWVDKRLRDSYPVEVAENMVLLGLQCVDEDPEKRPDMRHVTGLVSKLYLESKTWAESISLPTDFSVSIAPR